MKGIYNEKSAAEYIKMLKSNKDVTKLSNDIITKKLESKKIKVAKKITTKLVNVKIHLEPELHNALKRYLFNEGYTMSGFMRRLIVEHLIK
jgi:hypothetical protein